MSFPYSIVFLLYLNCFWREDHEQKLDGAFYNPATTVGDPNVIGCPQEVALDTTVIGFPAAKILGAPVNTTELV
jgi:hypothetical protein